MHIENSAFLITGGSSGLGAACAEQLVRAGGNVVLVDIKATKGYALAGKLGANARFVHADVTDEAAVSGAVDEAKSAFGSLQGLVNCAGIVHGAKVLGKRGPHDLGAFTRVVTINLVGTFNVIRLAAAAIAESEPDAEGERGVIVSTASIAAFDGQIGQAAYSASKAGIAGMTLPIARELAQHGIRVVTIAPGIFDTPMMASLPEQVRESLAEQVPFPPRLGRPSEFAALVRHIVENRMINGEVIRLDGAIRMAPR
jgi:NAD(P)-dependent dehydrogenase (short-subunit alcohol dehydrogenase family)